MSVTTHPVTQSNLWLRHIFIVVAAITILLAAAGMIYQILASARDRRAHPLSGQLVDVGGYTMHINCTGQGTPTVILDSGLGDSYISWNKVQPELAKRTRVCSYDRAGLGFSDASPHPRTSQNFAEELHTLLRRAGIAPPFVLVGHSMGGFDVRLYASLYPQDVAGMVLVDSSHPEQQKRFPPAVNDLAASDLRQQEFLAAITPFGIPRILGFCGSDAEIRAAECNFHSAREGVAELRAFATSAAQTATTGSLGNIPLVVLSHDPNTPQPDLPEDLVKPFNDAWEKMQEELAQLSPRSTHVIAKNSGHYIQLDRPDLVIEAVRNVVDQARQVQAVKESSPESAAATNREKTNNEKRRTCLRSAVYVQPLTQKVGVKVSVVVVPVAGTEIDAKLSCSLTREGRALDVLASDGALIIQPSEILSVELLPRFQE